MEGVWDADLSPLFHRQPCNATDGASHESPSSSTSTSHQQHSCHQQQHHQHKQQLSHLQQHHQQQHHLHRHHTHRRRHQTVPRSSAAAACCSISHPTRNLSDSSTAAAAAASAAAAMLLPPALKFSILPAPLVASLAAPLLHAGVPVSSRAISASHCSKSRSLETLTAPGALYSPTLSSSPSPSPSPLSSQSLVGSGANDGHGQQLSGVFAACASLRAADAPAAVERQERQANVKPLVRSRSLAAGSIAEGSALRSADAGALRAAKRHASSETKAARSVGRSSQCGDMGEGEDEETDSASSCLPATGQSASPVEGNSRRAVEQQSVSEGEVVKRQRKNSAGSTLFPAFRTATLPLGDVAGGVCGWGWSVGGSSSGAGGSSSTVGGGSSGKVGKEGRAALRRTAQGQGALRRGNDGGSEKSKERTEIAKLRADLAAARADLSRSADELAASRAELAECTEEVAELQTMVARAGLDWARERQEKTKLSGQCLELETELEAARKAVADERQRREKVEAFAQAVLERATREREQIERERDELRQADSWREQNVRGKLHDAQAELAERLGLLDFLHAQLLRKFREAGLGSPWNGAEGEECSVEQTLRLLGQPEGKRWLMGLGLGDGPPTPSVEDGGKPGWSHVPQENFGEGCTDLCSGDLQQAGGRCGLGLAVRDRGEGMAKEWPAHRVMLWEKQKQQQQQQQQRDQLQQDQPCSEAMTGQCERSKPANHSTAVTAALAAWPVPPEPLSGTQPQPLVATTAGCRCTCHQHAPAPLSPFRPRDGTATEFAAPLDLSPSLASLWSDLSVDLSSCTGGSAGGAADGPPSGGTDASLLQFLAWFTAQWPLFSQCCGPRGQQHGRGGSSSTARSQSEDEEAAARLLARVSAAWPGQVES